MREKNRIIRRRGQSGQATIELAMMLVGLTAMILGIIYVCGLTMANNRILLASKFRAEQYSRNGTTPTVSTVEYARWDYTGYAFPDGKKATIPFLAGDRLVFDTGSSIADADYNLQNQADSEQKEFGFYTWLDPHKLDPDQFPDDFKAGIATYGHALNAAELVRGQVSTNDPISGFEGKDRKKQTQLRRAYGQWFGVKITSDMLDDIPANKVYMPMTPGKE